MRLSQLIRHPIFHDGINLILVHFDTHQVHHLEQSDTKITTVHPVIIALGGLGNFRQGRRRIVLFAHERRFDIGARLVLGPKFQGGRFGAHVLDVHARRREQRLDNGFSHFVTFRIILEQQIERGDQSEAPKRISLEAGIDGNQMRRADQVGNHVFVQGIDRVTQFLRKLGKSFADGPNLGTGQVSESTGKVRVGLAGLVFGLSE